jgi:cytidylate kinase
VIRTGVDTSDPDAILDALTDHAIGFEDGDVILDGTSVRTAIRSAEVTAAVSAVSALPKVRERIVGLQREWVATHGGTAVVEGRDIGTVVFPEAPVKVFLTARPEVRAARRAGDAEVSGVSIAEVAEALSARDTADATRQTSPMRPAVDATIIDTSDQGIDQVVLEILDLVDAVSE